MFVSVWVCVPRMKGSPERSSRYPILARWIVQRSQILRPIRRPKAPLEALTIPSVRRRKRLWHPKRTGVLTGPIEFTIQCSLFFRNTTSPSLIHSSVTPFCGSNCRFEVGLGLGMTQIVLPLKGPGRKGEARRQCRAGALIGDALTHIETPFIHRKIAPDSCAQVIGRRGPETPHPHTAVPGGEGG